VSDSSVFLEQISIRNCSKAQGAGGMKNAHERFGRLFYRRQTEKTATYLRVFLNAFVGEGQGRAHLVPIASGDVEIRALAAANADGDSFTVMDPYANESVVALGKKPLCFRGAITVPGRKTTAAPSGELLIGIGGQHFGWEAAFGQ
jgi:hypothetical protein